MPAEDASVLDPLDQPTTRRDLGVTEAAIRRDITATQVSVRDDLRDTEAALRQEIAASEVAVRQDPAIGGRLHGVEARHGRRLAAAVLESKRLKRRH